jgi:thiol-disulfide isomerase/thioredoxin
MEVFSWLIPFFPDCQEAFPTLVKLSKVYDAAKLRMTFHVFPLPYHRNAFLVAQVMFQKCHLMFKAAAVVSAVKEENFVPFATGIYSVMDEFGSAASNLTEADVVARLSDIAASAGVSYDVFLAGMKNSDRNMDARISWKYGCSRGVSGTPTFFVNGVPVAAESWWTVAEWKQVIDPLVGVSHTRTARSSFSNSNIVDACPSGRVECHYLPGKVECCKPGEGCIPNVGCRC